MLHGAARDHEKGSDDANSCDHKKSSDDANSCGHEKAAATLIDPN